MPDDPPMIATCCNDMTCISFVRGCECCWKSVRALHLASSGEGQTVLVLSWYCSCYDSDHDRPQDPLRSPPPRVRGLPALPPRKADACKCRPACWLPATDARAAA